MDQRKEHYVFFIALLFPWHMFGQTLPVGLWRTPWAKRQLTDEQISLGNLDKIRERKDFKLRFAHDFKIIGIKDISNSELTDIVASLGLDPFTHRIYAFGKQARFEFQKISLINTSFKTSVDLYIKKFPPKDKKFHDIAEGDNVSLLFDDVWPMFIYNQSAHVLMNCDMWDFQIGYSGVAMPDKGKRAAREAANLVAAIIKNGKTLNLSLPSRLEFYRRSYTDLPPVKSSGWRDVYAYLWPLPALVFGSFFLVVFFVIFSLFVLPILIWIASLFR